jgi:sugar phosphate isomerase/epimerase
MAKVTACSTLAFALSPIETALEHIRGYGFDRVEISDQLTHAQHFSNDASRSVDPHAVRDLLKHHSLTPVAANCTFATFYSEELGLERKPRETQSGAERDDIRRAKENVVSYKLQDPRQADAFRDRARKHVDNAAIVGIPMVCLHASRRIQIDDIDRELRVSAEVFDEMAEYAKAAGIRVMLEMPHVWQVYFDAEHSKRMLSYLKSDNIGVLIDSTHWHTSGYDIDEYVGFLGPRLWHVHLRDAAGRDTPAGNFLLEATPGKGEVDFGLLGQTLDKYGYNGHVTLETEYKNYSDVGEVDAENAFAMAHLRSVGWGTP